jgi:hypothetical protein
MPVGDTNIFSGSTAPADGYSFSATDYSALIRSIPNTGTMSSPKSQATLNNIIMEAIEGMSSIADWTAQESWEFEQRVNTRLLAAATADPEDTELQTVAQNIQRDRNLFQIYRDKLQEVENLKAQALEAAVAGDWDTHASIRGAETAAEKILKDMTHFPDGTLRPDNTFMRVGGVGYENWGVERASILYNPDDLSAFDKDFEKVYGDPSIYDRAAKGLIFGPMGVQYNFILDGEIPGDPAVKVGEVDDKGQGTDIGVTSGSGAIDSILRKILGQDHGGWVYAAIEGGIAALEKATGLPVTVLVDILNNTVGKGRQVVQEKILDAVETAGKVLTGGESGTATAGGTGTGRGAAEATAAATSASTAGKKSKKDWQKTVTAILGGIGAAAAVSGWFKDDDDDDDDDANKVVTTGDDDDDTTTTTTTTTPDPITGTLSLDKPSVEGTLAPQGYGSLDALDSILGGTGSVNVAGGTGSEDIFGGSGAVDVAGGTGSADIFGGSGAIDVAGGTGSADIFGGSGNVNAFGGVGGADIFGGSGAIDVAGGTGGSDLYGGTGTLDALVNFLGLNTAGGFEPGASGSLETLASGSLDTLNTGSLDNLNTGALNYLPRMSSGVQGIRETPGDVVDIDYLYDIGGESIFAPMVYDDDEDQKEKGERLYVYQEGGTVENQDAVDALVRRPGQYGRNYFTPGEFVPTGTAVGGAALDSNLIQIPEYTYNRNLLPAFGGPALTSTGMPVETSTVGGLGDAVNSSTASTIGTIGAETVIPGVDTQTGVLTSSDVDTTEGASFVDPVYDYLTNLGFGGTPQNITQTHVQDFLTSGFTLDELASALGTTTSQLQAIADYSAPVQTQNALQQYLSTLGYGASPKTLTKEDVTSFMGQENFTLAEIASELGVSEDLLNQIYSYTPSTATSLTPVETYLINKGYGGEGQAISQADAVEFLDSSDFTIEQIAEELGLTVADIQNAATYGGQTATSTGLSELQNYLINQGFGGGGKEVTADDVAAFGESDFNLDEIASALGLTVADLNAIEQYAGQTATSTGLSDIQNYLINQGFGGAGKAVTAADVTAFGESNFSLEDIASALGLTAADLNAVGASTATSTGLSEIQNYLTEQGFGGAGKAVTAEDITAFGESNFSLEDIASALGLTVADLNAVGAGTAQATGLSEIQNYLTEQGFGGAGRAVTVEDITAFGESNFSLEDIASALGLTVADLNAVGADAASSTGLSGLQNYLINQGFGGAGRNITAGDITGFKNSGFSLSEIASALGVTVDTLNAISSYTAPSAGGTTLYSYLSNLGFGSDAVTITPAIAKEFSVGGADLGFSLSQIASALNVTEAQLSSLIAEHDAANTVQAAGGGLMQSQGYYLGGPTDGMADQVPATIDGAQPAALSDGEFVIPADVVSHLGNGNSEAGAQQLYGMMDRLREERTGTTRQGPEINPMQMMPA